MGTGGLPPLPAPNAPIPAGVLNRAGRLLPPRRQHHALRQRRRADHQVHRARSPKRDLARSDAGGRAAVLFPSSKPPASMASIREPGSSTSSPACRTPAQRVRELVREPAPRTALVGAQHDWQPFGCWKPSYAIAAGAAERRMDEEERDRAGLIHAGIGRLCV